MLHLRKDGATSPTRIRNYNLMITIENHNFVIVNHNRAKSKMCWTTARTGRPVRSEFVIIIFELQFCNYDFIIIIFYERTCAHYCQDGTTSPIRTHNSYFLLQFYITFYNYNLLINLVQSQVSSCLLNYRKDGTTSQSNFIITILQLQFITWFTIAGVVVPAQLPQGRDDLLEPRLHAPRRAPQQAGPQFRIMYIIYIMLIYYISYFKGPTIGTTSACSPSRSSADGRARPRAQRLYALQPVGS